MATATATADAEYYYGGSEHRVTVSYTHTPSPVRPCRYRYRIEREQDSDQANDEYYEQRANENGYDDNENDDPRGNEPVSAQDEGSYSGQYYGPPISVKFTPTKCGHHHHHCAHSCDHDTVKPIVSSSKRRLFPGSRHSSSCRRLSPEDLDDSESTTSSPNDEDYDGGEEHDQDYEDSGRSHLRSSARSASRGRSNRSDRTPLRPAERPDADQLNRSMDRSTSSGKAESHVGTVVQALQDGLRDRAALVDDLLDRVSSLDDARADAQRHAGDLRMALARAKAMAKEAAKRADTADLALANVQGGVVQLQQERERERIEMQSLIERLKLENEHAQKELARVKTELHICAGARDEFKLKLQQQTDELNNAILRVERAEKRAAQAEASTVSLNDQLMNALGAKETLEQQLATERKEYASALQQHEKLLSETKEKLHATSTARSEAENRASEALLALNQARDTLTRLQQENDHLVQRNNELSRDKEDLRNSAADLANSLARVQSQATDLAEALRKEREAHENAKAVCNILRRDAAAQEKELIARTEELKTVTEQLTVQREELLAQVLKAERTATEKAAEIAQLQKELEAERSAKAKLIQERDLRERESVQRERELAQSRLADLQAEAARREAYLQDRLEAAIRLERQSLNEERAAMAASREAAAAQARAEEVRAREAAIRDLREAMSREQRLHAEEIERLNRAHTDYMNGEEARIRSAVSDALKKYAAEMEAQLEKERTAHANELAREKLAFGDRVEELVRRHEAELAQVRAALAAAEAQYENRLAQARAVAEQKEASELERALAEAAELHRLRMEDQRGSFREQLVRVTTELEDANRAMQASLAERDAAVAQRDELVRALNAQRMEAEQQIAELGHQLELSRGETRQVAEAKQSSDAEVKRLRAVLSEMASDFQSQSQQALARVADLEQLLQASEKEKKELQNEVVRLSKAFHDYVDANDAAHAKALAEAEDKIQQLEQRIRDYEWRANLSSVTSEPSQKSMRQAAKAHMSAPSAQNEPEEETPSFNISLPKGPSASVIRSLTPIHAPKAAAGLAQSGQALGRDLFVAAGQAVRGTGPLNTSTSSQPEFRYHHLPSAWNASHPNPTVRGVGLTPESQSQIPAQDATNVGRGVPPPVPSRPVPAHLRSSKPTAEESIELPAPMQRTDGYGTRDGDDEDEDDDLARLIGLRHREAELQFRADDEAMAAEKEQLERRYQSVKQTLALFDKIIAHKTALLEGEENPEQREPQGQQE